MVEFSCEGLAKKKQKTKKTLYEKIIIKKKKEKNGLNVCMLWHTELYGTTIRHPAWKGGAPRF